MQNKILIANRGEIALRIMRATKELGIPHVVVYSTADQDSLHVKLADEAICIGGPKSHESYLNINNVLSAAIATGCNAIHPGYGFLSENAKFVEMVEECNIKFIGPKSKTIAMIGDKASARKIAQDAGVPIVMGSDGIIADAKEGLKIARKIGYPVMIKATSGGGGRGISIVKSDDEFLKAFEKTSLEAEANFKDGALYIEKFIEAPRHIEIQIMADGHGNVVHLYERDCSLQRRNQKMVEEAPSTSLNDILRRKIAASAVKLAKAIAYENAGTMEFLVDAKGNHYFIEMNTRIQVEHPITEMITGVDLVKEQIHVAYGKQLSFKQRDIKIRGHAIECRINAEDPMNHFMPTPGKITNMIMPGGLGVRLDTHIYPSYVVPPFYDSMLGKLIVHAPTRKEAIKKMRMALEQFIVEGIKTNIEFQYLVMHHIDFIKGHYDTSFIARFIALIEGERNG
jgi:acetyl-CoA carboxylase, biotin carboxylase subunit